MEAFRLAMGQPWAITEEALDALVSMSLSAASYGSRPAAKDSFERYGDVAVLPIRGVITHHGDMWSWLFGDATVDALGNQFRAAMADDSVKAIVLDIDSPGGTVAGTGEFADEVLKARGKKPVVGIANAGANSAAYWIGSAADAFFATPSALVGSVGVYMLHVDYSQAMDEAGIKPSYVAAGKYKVEGNPYEPLGDEARDHLQSIVDDSYSRFVNGVARGRRVSEATVRNGFGQGRALPAKAALAAGMVDGIKTLDWVIAHASSIKASAAADAPAAEGEGIEPHADEEGQKRLARLRWHGLKAAEAAI